MKLLLSSGNNKEARVQLEWSEKGEEKQQISSERCQGFVVGPCKVLGFYFE